MEFFQPERQISRQQFRSIYEHGTTTSSIPAHLPKKETMPGSPIYTSKEDAFLDAKYIKENDDELNAVGFRKWEISATEQR